MMKKFFINKTIVAAAMMLTAGMFTACSSSDDNNSTTPKEEEKTQVATTGKLYVFEFLHTKATTWTDCTSILKNGSTESKKSFAADATTLSKLTNANLVAALKKEYEDAKGLFNEVEALSAEAAPLIVDSISLTTFPSSTNVTFNYALKAGFDAKGEEQDFVYLAGCCFIDNLGKVQYSDLNSQVYAGLGAAHLSEFITDLDAISDNKMTVTITKSNTGLSLSSAKQK